MFGLLLLCSVDVWTELPSGSLLAMFNTCDCMSVKCLCMCTEFIGIFNLSLLSSFQSLVYIVFVFWM